MDQGTRFREEWSDCRRNFVNSLCNIEDVVCQLHEAGIVHDSVRDDIMRRRMEQQRKDALFNYFAEFSFETVCKIPEILKVAENQTLAYMLEILIASITGASITKIGVDSREDVVNRSTTGAGGVLSTDGAYEPEPLPPPPQVSSKQSARDLVLLAGNASTLEKALKQIHNLDELVNLDPDTQDTTLLACFRRHKDIEECVKIVLEIYIELKSRIEAPNQTTQQTSNTDSTNSNRTHPSRPSSLSEFLESKDSNGNTAAHLAANLSLSDLIFTLFKDYGCDIFSENDEGCTVLEIMYAKTPDAVNLILDETLAGSANYTASRALELDVDFSPVIGKPIASNEGENHPETHYDEVAFLANVINKHKTRQKKFLRHPLINLFVELKWQKIRNYVCLTSFLRILLKLFYTFLVIQVFHVNCRYTPSHNNIKTTTSTGGSGSAGSESNSKIGAVIDHVSLDRDTKDSVINYIFGSLRPFEAVTPCDLSTFWTVVTVLVILFVSLLFVQEVCELSLIVINEFRRGPRRKQNIPYAVCQGVKDYGSSFRNWIQLISYSLMLAVSSFVYQPNQADLSYSLASISILFVWILILMEMGDLSSTLGLYIQILGKVTKSFGMLIPVYTLPLIAFSISFGLTFPDEKPFETLLKGLSKVIIMMTGEMDYNGIFYKDGKDDPGPPLPLTGHVVFIAFTLLMTLILANLLIGLVVSDVKELREKAEVILLSRKIEQCRMMESTLVLFHMVKSRRQKSSDTAQPAWHSKFCVVHPELIGKRNKTIKIAFEQVPAALQQKIRELLINVTDYDKRKTS